MTKVANNAEKVEVKTRSDLRKWLLKHHLQKEGIWLVTYKKSQEHYLPYNDFR